MRNAAYFRAKAEKCRYLAAQATDEGTAANLRMLADDYEEEARAIESEPDPDPLMPIPN